MNSSITVTLMTDASGNAEVVTEPTPFEAVRLSSIHYVKPEADGFADGVDVSVSNADTGEVLWAEQNVNASIVRRPRAPVHTTNGTPALYAEGGSPVLDRITLARDRVKVTVSNGGNAKVGTFIIVFE